MSNDNHSTVGTSTIVSEILLEYEKAVRDGKNPEIEEYLRGEGKYRQRLLVELLHSQLELSLRAGQPLRLRDILAKYPELAQLPDDLFSLLSSEIAALRQRGEHPVIQDYQAEFGAILGTRLNELFEKRDSTGQDNNLGKVIGGRYTLIKALGQGGMGTVYLAEQKEPVKRLVALKLIKSGIDSRNYIIRFEAERQALAVMDHPNIARVYDGGTTAEQQPYFVMELVQGIPITQYCDEHRLSPKARLELFVHICQAVQHAHQKGIIHRDLKPSNVLVAEVDGKPVPKVIDFGLAKAKELSLTDESIEELGAVGTPAYMSPEQADPGNNDVDTRTDVYALGVILYELLTGSTPIDSKQFRRGAVLEMLRMVREVDPPKPSTKLSLAEALPSIAANRALEPKQLLAWVRGDIDWIVMKALEKDRDRRYESANGFAVDLIRYLAGEAVEAHPPSRWYRVRKFVRRNKVQVVAAGLVMLSLAGGIMGIGFALAEANAQKEIAIEERDKKEKQRQLAEKLMAAEKLAKEQVEKSNEILLSIFSDLDIYEMRHGVEPLESVLGKRLVQASKQLGGSAIGESINVSRLQNRLGMTLYSLGQYQEARILYQEVLELTKTKLGPYHRNTVAAMNNLGTSYLEQNEYEEACKLFQEAMEISSVHLDPTDADSYASMSNLASCYSQMGRRADALKLREEALKRFRAILGPNHPHTIGAKNNLANSYLDLGNKEEALKLRVEVLEQSKKVQGIDHPDTLSHMDNLASLLDREEEVLKLLETAMDYSKKRMGPDHPITLSRMHRLAFSYDRFGKHVEALELLRSALALRQQRLGVNHPITIQTDLNLGRLLNNQGKYPDALNHLEGAFARYRGKIGDRHPDVLRARGLVALIYLELGQTEKSRNVVKEIERLLDGNNPNPDYELHNDLRHLNLAAENQRLAMKHCDYALKARCMDDYIIRCVAGDLSDTKSAITKLKDLIEENKELKYLKAACTITLAGLVEGKEERKSLLQSILSDTDPELTLYRKAAQLKYQQVTQY